MALEICFIVRLASPTIPAIRYASIVWKSMCVPAGRQHDSASESCACILSCCLLQQDLDSGRLCSCHSRSLCSPSAPYLCLCVTTDVHLTRSPLQAKGIMREGMTFSIEPMINAGVWKDTHWPDEWTCTTKDGRRSAQFEHTLLVTATGCEALTKRLPSSPPLWWEAEQQAAPVPSAQL